MCVCVCRSLPYVGLRQLICGNNEPRINPLPPPPFLISSLSLSLSLLALCLSCSLCERERYIALSSPIRTCFNHLRARLSLSLSPSLSCTLPLALSAIDTKTSPRTYSSYSLLYYYYYYCYCSILHSTVYSLFIYIYVYIFVFLCTIYISMSYIDPLLLTRQPSSITLLTLLIPLPAQCHHLVQCNHPSFHTYQQSIRGRSAHPLATLCLSFCARVFLSDS